MSSVFTKPRQKLPQTPLDVSLPDVQRLLCELQGNILQDHDRSDARHLFIQFGSDAERSRHLVRVLSENVTSAHQELNKNVETLFTSFLLSASGYRKLRLEDKMPCQEAFRVGMQDLTTPIVVNPDFDPVPNPCADPAVDTWHTPFPTGMPDALLILALSGDDANEKLTKEQKHKQQIISKHGGTVTGVYEAYRVKNENGQDTEQFGFADGISNLIFLQSDYTEAKDKTTTGSFLPGADPLAKLELILEKDKIGGPCSYGSYLVYRRLEQNVDLFKQYGKMIQEELKKAGQDISQDEAEARMIGRHKSGVPLIENLSGVKPEFRKAAVNFNYADDKDGKQCPWAAHVRKVDPRGSSVTGPNDFRSKIVRRGMLYGKDPQSRGLLFLCYQSQINIGFLVQQNRWANREVFGEKPPPKVGLDMVVGQYLKESPPTVKQIMYGDKEKPPVRLLIKNCVTMRGGEYFFAPAVSTLQKMK
ncbi:multifunctional dye peroxidase DyP2-like isoform X2 [Corticium candelabrum]|uniref:multifunctional dye peroxidase DyP2-like isoform X2 n=1 Tax=Corticium candelabrum TaxID=121492 RepID=UPI002E259EC2|nr:multifunctional dye peroxidase DyP2-like isoform X2 [Corticium candelabrum]